jgi:hypothetical protein
MLKGMENMIYIFFKVLENYLFLIIYIHNFLGLGFKKTPNSSKKSREEKKSELAL